jgi:hypothetical protein
VSSLLARTAPGVRIVVDKYSEVPSEKERRAFAAAVEISARLGVRFTSERDVAVSWFRRDDSRTVLGHSHRSGRECSVAVGMSEEETVETVAHELCHARQGQDGRTDPEDVLEDEANIFGQLVAEVWKLEHRERSPQPRAAVAGHR